MVPAPDGNRKVASAGAEREPAAGRFHVGRPDVAVLGRADPEDICLAAGGDLSQPGVVAEHRAAVGRQRGEQLRLGIGDFSQAAELAEMRVADAGDDADRRPGKLGQRGDLAGMIRPQLQHRVVVDRLDGRHAQRNAELVVEVSRAGRAAEPPAKHAVNHLPGRRLAGAAADGDYRRRRVVAAIAGPVVQSSFGVIDANCPTSLGYNRGPLALWERVRVRAGRTGPFSQKERGGICDDSASRAAGESLSGELTAVEVRTAKSPEHVPRLDPAAIAYDRPERRIGRPFRHKPAADRSA